MCLQVPINLTLAELRAARNTSMDDTMNRLEVRIDRPSNRAPLTPSAAICFDLDQRARPQAAPFMSRRFTAVSACSLGGEQGLHRKGADGEFKFCFGFSPNLSSTSVNLRDRVRR